MDEFAARFAVTTGAGELTEVSRARVMLGRSVRTQVNRRDPRGNVDSSTPVHSSFTVSWDLDFSDDAASLGVILDALCGPGVRALAEGAAVPVVSAAAAMADGAEWSLSGGVLQEWQIVIGNASLVTMATTWAFSGLDAAEFTPEAAGQPWEAAAAADCRVTMGGAEAVAFAGNLIFTREAIPAGFGLSGRAEWFAGRLAVDCIGTFRLRFNTAEDWLAAMQDQFTDSLTVELTAGDHVLTVAIPFATFLCRARRVVSREMVDYDIEMLALRQDANSVVFTQSGGRDSV